MVRATLDWSKEGSGTASRTNSFAHGNRVTDSSVSMILVHSPLDIHMTLPTFADVESAAHQIAGAAHRTPVATSRSVNGRTGAEIFFKCENLQRSGAFKFRGAYNALSRLNPDQRLRGIVAFSSGNRAQAVALAAQLLDNPRTIVMPTDAPAVKRRATEGYGGQV